MNGWRAITAGVTITVAMGSVIAAGGPTNTIRSASAARAEAVPFDTSGWKTDFNRHSVPLTEIMSGGPPKDGIPAIDRPEFVSASAADEWLKLKEPVILFAREGDVRAYPLQILIWHEIANDTVAGLPVAITFCPLCHTAIAFDRRAAGRVLDFGTTGRLRFSDLVMYDRQTESWWQQATGEAIVGSLSGTHLTPPPAQIISWEMFKQAFPSGRVLSRRTGYQRSTGKTRTPDTTASMRRRFYTGALRTPACGRWNGWSRFRSGRRMSSIRSARSSGCTSSTTPSAGDRSPFSSERA